MNEEPVTPDPVDPVDVVDEDVDGHGMPIQVGTVIGGTFERSASADRTARGHSRTTRKARRRQESRAPQFPPDSEN